MHKLFDFLDEQLAEVLPLLYLFGTTFGTIYFFVGRDFLNINDVLRSDPLLILVFVAGVTAALAVELHAYLQQRRARQTWQEVIRTPEDSPNYAAVRKASRTAQLWMIALLVFQIISSEGFWLTASPMTHASAFDWLAVLLRGAAIPVFLYGTGFLSRLRQDAVGILAKRAEKMLNKTMDVVGRQWNGRLETSARSGTNLAPVAIDLMMDAGETQAAGRIRLIENGLAAGEQQRGTAAGFVRDATSGLYVPQSLKSSGAKRPTVDQSRTAVPAAPTTPPERPSGMRSLADARKARKAVKKTPEQRVFAVLDSEPEASLRSIERRAHVSHQTAVDMRAKWQLQRDGEAVIEAAS